ncbi:hypothetical protein CXQ80_22385 [Pseudomonas sp. 02C 26]|nr:hypothetical protein CXQ80_22385 [Pseudomonas sp. 02C 26]
MADSPVNCLIAQARAESLVEAPELLKARVERSGDRRWLADGEATTAEAPRRKAIGHGYIGFRTQRVRSDRRVRLRNPGGVGWNENRGRGPCFFSC